MKTWQRLLAAFAASALASPALAADVPPVIAPLVIAAPVVSAPTLAGYIEAFAGYGRGRDDNPEPNPDIPWRVAGFGGAARIAWQAVTAFGIQVDAWGEHWSGRALCDGAPCGDTGVDNIFGGGTHFTGRLGTAGRVGTLVSVGNSFGDVFVNVGAEATYGTAAFRVVGQGGYTFIVAGNGVGSELRDFYGVVLATFFPRPSIAITADIGADIFRATGGFTAFTLRWGGRAEIQLGDGPLSAFAAYQGVRTHTSNGQTEWSHYFGLGIGLSFGGDTLRARDGAVGLGDWNPIYGGTFPH